MVHIKPIQNPYVRKKCVLILYYNSKPCSVKLVAEIILSLLYSSKKLYHVCVHLVCYVRGELGEFSGALSVE